MRLKSKSPGITASRACITVRTGTATRAPLKEFRLPRDLACYCELSGVSGTKDTSGSRTPPASEGPSVSRGPSQQSEARDTDTNSSKDGSLLEGVKSREWLDSWEPVKPKGFRQYAASGLRKPVQPTLSQGPRLAGVKVYGQGRHQNLNTKVALRIVDQHGRLLLIRDTRSQGHRGMWQIPSLQLHATGCAHLQGVVMARGFLETVPPSFDLKPHSFMSSRRLGQPVLVLLLQASVKCEDLCPSRGGFREGEFKWVSDQEYQSLHEEVAQVLYMRSPWYVRGNHSSTASLHCMPGFEARHRVRSRSKARETPDLTGQNFPTVKRMLLFVTAACVYDEESGKVLIAQRIKDQNPKHVGLWEWPGGKVELGETTDKAVVREFKEEIGIDLDPTALQPMWFTERHYFKRNLVVLYYFCTKFSGTARGAEGQPIEWASLTDLKQQTRKFLPGDDLFAQKVKKQMMKRGADSKDCS